MNRTARIHQNILVGILAALVFLTGAFAILPRIAFAAETGTYTMTANPYYENPATGKVEDSGQNSGIGQGMTESVLGGEALLEVDENGKNFLTIRFGLMDNITDVRLSYQNNGEEAYTPLEYSIVKESAENNTVDMRMEIPNESVILRAEFYVTPMGRDVIFFMSFADPVEGTGDFVTGLDVLQENVSPEVAEEVNTAAEASPIVTQEDANSTQHEMMNETPQEVNSPKQDNTIFTICIIAIVVGVAIVGYVVYRKKKRKA